MADGPDFDRISAIADERISGIFKAAASWAGEAPAPLTPSIRAVCVRLAEMVADQRHYLAPLPEPLESERRAVLMLVADRLRTGPASIELRSDLEGLAKMELRATGSWSLVAGAQAEWVQTAIDFLQQRRLEITTDDRPDEYWAEDVVAGIIASVKGLIGADDLHGTIERQYAGQGRPPRPDNDD